MLVTILTSPYGWTSDEVVLLPAVASAGLSRRRFSMELLVCINFAALFLILVRSRLSIWLPAAWLAWYLYASWSESGGGAGGNDYTDVDQEAFADS